MGEEKKLPNDQIYLVQTIYMECLEHNINFVQAKLFKYLQNLIHQLNVGKFGFGKYSRVVEIEKLV